MFNSKYNFTTHTFLHTPRRRARTHSYDFIPLYWLKQHYLYIPGSGDFFRRTGISPGRLTNTSSEQTNITASAELFAQRQATINFATSQPPVAYAKRRYKYQRTAKDLHTLRRPRLIAPHLHGFRIPYFYIRRPDMTWQYYPAVMLVYYYQTGIWIDWQTTRVLQRDGNMWNLAWGNLTVTGVADYLHQTARHH